MIPPRAARNLTKCTRRLTGPALGTILEHMDDSPSDGGFIPAGDGDHVAVHIERSLSASPDRVWAALTEPAQLAAWFWPARLGVRASTDPRPGGSFRIEGSDQAYAMAVSGRYEVVRDPGRLVFSWRWDGDTDETLVTVKLSDDGPGRTSLELTHTGFADVATRDDHITGWSDCLDRLPAFLGLAPSCGIDPLNPLIEPVTRAAASKPDPSPDVGGLSPPLTYRGGRAQP
jgi:uncharacterized protein YndB with AHSA1/START domain